MNKLLLIYLLSVLGFLAGQAQQVSGSAKGHDYVDLGLPSGTLWATANIGADSVDVCGDYYSWGETRVKVDYNCKNYAFYTGPYEEITKYRTPTASVPGDALLQLQKQDDVASAVWGEPWRMPTAEQAQELMDNCRRKWVEGYNGMAVSGLLLTGPNGNQLFFPAAGFYDGRKLNGRGFVGDYWLIDLFEESGYGALVLDFNQSDCANGVANRHMGQSVRAVLLKEKVGKIRR